MYFDFLAGRPLEIEALTGRHRGAGGEQALDRHARTIARSLSCYGAINDRVRAGAIVLHHH